MTMPRLDDALSGRPAGVSGKIWLIAEDENDYRIVQAFIKARKVAVKVEWRRPSGRTPGLSRLAAELSKLMLEVEGFRSGDDCIVVLHDDDIHRCTKT